MKKFLSLVLALVMAMSLVTISAGAVEYKDLTDKDEIQYEEAVAVLNRIGVITGYDDGSFQPTKELTRGAAAKIIVSLLIGPEAANNLPNNSSPYPDVPANHTFAGVISFCKTKNIISGYGDGTFKPANSLTGYAFAKMLLGAVGYNSELERFTGSGWTNNVAAIGQSAGLFDRLKFDGSAAVNREQACQLALNALKATVVEYSQGINVNVTGADTNVVVSGGQTRSFKTSNQEFARNIRTKFIDNVDDDYYTVEFAEEHFVDLRLEHNKWSPTDDEFGRPSSEWSYKKVTIGTYPLEADFTYTTQIAHADTKIDDNSNKVTKLGLRGYELVSDSRQETQDYTDLWLNGMPVYKWGRTHEVGEIADYTDNGTLVQVYVSENDADFITDVVVIQTQLMEVKRVGSDYVSLEQKDPDDPTTIGHAFNQAAIQRDVKDVKEANENYAVLKELKDGDTVAVIPVADNHSTNLSTDMIVSKAYVPETVTGVLTRTDMYDEEVTDITVGGTNYKVAQWNDKMKDVNADVIKVTRKDVTLTLDEYGNALFADEPGSTSEYMVIGSYYRSLENGKLVTYVHGWDVGGDEVDLNLGANGDNYLNVQNMVPGDLVRYTSAARGSAEWILEDHTGNFGISGDNALKNRTNIYDIDSAAQNLGTTTPYELRANNASALLRNVIAANVNATSDTDAMANDATTRAERTFLFKNSVKFLFVSFDDEGDVDSIEFQKGAQNVSNEDLLKYNTYYGSSAANAAEAYFNKDGAVQAVVVKTESGNAQNGNLMYIKDHWGGHTVNDNGNGQKVYGYTVAMMKSDGTVDHDVNIWTNRNLALHTFATYNESTLEGFEPYYTSKAYDQQMRSTATMVVHMDSDGVRAGTSNLAKVYNVETVGGNALYSGTNNNDGTWGVTGGHPNSRPTTANVLTNINALSSSMIFDKVNFGDTRGDATAGETVIWLDAAKNNWVDLTNNGINEADDLADFENIELALIINDNPNSDSFRHTSMIVVVNAEKSSERPAAIHTVTIEKSVVEAGKIRLTATVGNLPEGYKNVKYQWYKDGAAIAGATGSTYDVAATADGSYTCKVTYEQSGKLLTSKPKESNPITIAPAPAVDGVKIAVPTAANTNRGEAITYKAVATVNGVAVTSNANIRYTWKIDGVDAETLGATVKVNADGTTELVIPADKAASMAGKTVTCVPSVIDAAGTETPVVIAPEDVEKVEQTETGAIGTTPAEDTNVPAPGDLPDSPTATDAVVTFEIGANTMVTYKGATLTSASPSTFTVAKGEIITVVAEKMGSASGVVSVTPSESIVFVDETVDNGQRFVVNASGTITVSLDAPDLNKVAAAFTKTALADRADSIPADVLNAGYGLTTSASNGKITLAFTHTGLYGHTNANGTKAYQIGFNVPETIGDWTVSNVTVVNKWQTEGSQGYVNFGTSGEGGYWLTLYRANAPAGGDLAPAMGDNGVTTGTVTLTKSGVDVKVPLVVDCSNVVVYGWDATYTRPGA